MKEENTKESIEHKKENPKEPLENNGKNVKEKIVPAYQRKDETKGKKVKKKTDKKVIKSRITIAIIIVGILLIGLAIFGIVSLVNYNKYKPYRKYEETMKAYGFDKMYDNKSSDTGESVTKSEAVKMVLSCVLNTSDITDFLVEKNEEYNNADWVDYAKYKGIIGEADVNKDNADDKATYIEVIRYLANAKTKLLEKELDSSSDLKVKDIDKYKPDEKTAIEDMIANEIITVNTKKIKGNSNVFKGQLNELISNFAVKYNTITVNGEKINISEDKMPSNKDEYPYTLATVDKSIYEIENYKFNSENYLNPKATFNIKKEYYLQIEEVITEYFNTILNIDYTTINEESIKDSLRSLMLYGVDNDEISEYVKHVKDNKIKIKGTAKVNFPAVYYDGRNYRARTTIEYEILNSNTNTGIFFGDIDAEYDKDNTKLILDVPIGESIDNKSLTISNGSINNWIAGRVKYEM